MEISDIRRELGLENIDLEDIDRIKFQLQNLTDVIEGGLRSANLVEYRNTYVINAQDSLDATYPMYVHFNIISEMVKIISIKLSFWLLPFRSYSKAGAAQGTPSGGGDTSGTTTGTEGAMITGVWETLCTGIGDQSQYGYIPTGYILKHLADKDHTHSTPNHIHPDHTHSATYGIFEEETSPTIMVSVSRDNGLTYSLPMGSYTKDQETLDITRFIDKAGSKMIKFTSNVRARLSVQIEIKLDIKAR